MALLEALRQGRRPGGRAIALALGALAVVTVGGCVVFQYLGLAEEPLAFSHERHLAEGLACTDCHSSYEAGDEPQEVRPAQCALCHEDLDAEKPPERQVAALFDGESYRAAHATRFADEVKFSHATHVGSGASCESCHAPIATSGRVDASVAPRMDECIACHEKTGQATSCTTCHAVIGTEHAPPSHGQQWMTSHGVAVRAEMDGQANKCSLCHTERSCTTCHQDQAPKNHDNFWRLRGHGVVADMDRDSCSTCHESSSCERCHRENEPLSHHSGAFGAPLDTHCLSCHFPLQSENCSVCHKSAPSHLDAAPKPPNHFPGLDCRQCHGVNAPLPHVDNGDDCSFCHK
ncbi:MAG TPA: cytochrome c3 family protein [Planctomycetota bacterium]|nr:cytochrome c3 family protein [Planctomycetota bacterium]